MHIAVDLDDVTMDFWRSVCASINLEYGLAIDPEQTRDWEKNEVKQLTIFGEGRDWWSWLRDRDWIWATFKPVPGAIGGVQRLRQQGHYVEAVTKKPEWAEWTVWKWLGLWRPAFNTVTIVPSGGSKASSSQASLLIDDSPDNLTEWVASDQSRTAICFDQPWNRTMPNHSNIFHTYSWEGVLDKVERIANALQSTG